MSNQVVSTTSPLTGRARCVLPTCSAPATERFCCEVCRRVAYCSIEHFVLDIARHARECSEASPDVGYVKVLLFPVDGVAPRLETMAYKKTPVPQFNPNMTGLMETHATSYAPFFTPPGSITSRTVDQPDPPSEASGSGTSSSPSMSARNELRLQFYHTLPQGGGGGLNRTVSALLGRQAPVLWRGNLVGYRVRVYSDGRRQFVDVSMDDLAHFVTFLREEREPPQLGALRHPGRHGSANQASSSSTSSNSVRVASNLRLPRTPTDAGRSSGAASAGAPSPEDPSARVNDLIAEVADLRRFMQHELSRMQAMLKVFARQEVVGQLLLHERAITRQIFVLENLHLDSEELYQKFALMGALADADRQRAQGTRPRTARAYSTQDGWRLGTLSGAPRLLLSFFGSIASHPWKVFWVSFMLGCIFELWFGRAGVIAAAGQLS